jgi:nucleoside 2-deoxyribosyltransferase
MKIFLSASIRGGRHMLYVYTEILELLQSHGHDVLSSHVADPQLEDKESVMTEQEIYERDMGLLSRSECMIAEVSTPSIGVGYEICRALQLGMPVLCLYSQYSNVSAMILGNSSDLLIGKKYANYQEMRERILNFLAWQNIMPEYRIQKK